MSRRNACSMHIRECMSAGTLAPEEGPASSVRPTSNPKLQTSNVYPHKHSRFASLYRPVPEVISLPTNIAAVTHAEFISMQRTHHVSIMIYSSISQHTTSMRTLIGKRKKRVLIPSDANRFAFHFRECNIVFTKAELGF